MAADGGERPPEFMSTHPSPDTRMGDLRARLDQAREIRTAALDRGMVPDCVPGRIN